MGETIGNSNTAQRLTAWGYDAKPRLPHFPQSWNRYAYVDNTPLSATDPTGEKVIDCMWSGCGADDCPLCDYIGTSNTGNTGGITGSYSAALGTPGFIDVGWLFDVEQQEESRYVSLITTGWDPELGQFDPQGHGDTSSCESTVLSAVNQQFSTDFTTANVTQALVANGGEYNVTINATSLTTAQFNAINTGRYAGLGTMLTGIGPSLHITGPTALDPSAVFDKENNGADGGTSITFTAHIDSGYAYNPLGFLGHIITDVVNSDSRPACP